MVVNITPIPSHMAAECCRDLLGWKLPRRIGRDDCPSELKLWAKIKRDHDSSFFKPKNPLHLPREC